MTEILKAEPNPVGRQLQLTDVTRQQIMEVAALDGTIEEMAYYTGVSRTTIYNWFKLDPDLFDRVEALRQRPVLAARQEVVKGILGDKDFSLRYLERRKPREFSPTQKVEHGGAINVEHSLHNPQFKKNADELKTKYEADLRALYEEPEEIPSVPAEETPVVEVHEPTISNNPQGEATNL